MLQLAGLFWTTHSDGSKVPDMRVKRSTNRSGQKRFGMSVTFLAALCSTYLLSPAGVQAQSTTVLTFDHVSPHLYVQIQNGYGGLQWENFFVENALWNGGTDGYYRAMISSPNVAFNGLGNPASLSSSTLFTLNSASLTAVYVSQQQIRVQGFANGARRYDNTYIVTDLGPSTINFNYWDVDLVRFSIVSNPTGIFAMDNLMITVPEPSTTTMVLVALVLLALGFMTKRSELGSKLELAASQVP